MHKEIKKRLNSGSACYHLVQESFVFQFSVQKCKGQNIQNYNFTCCFVYVSYHLLLIVCASCNCAFVVDCPRDLVFTDLTFDQPICL